MTFVGGFFPQSPSPKDFPRQSQMEFDANIDLGRELSVLHTLLSECLPKVTSKVRLARLRLTPSGSQMVPHLLQCMVLMLYQLSTCLANSIHFSFIRHIGIMLNKFDIF